MGGDVIRPPGNMAHAVLRGPIWRKLAVENHQPYRHTPDWSRTGVIVVTGPVMVTLSYQWYVPSMPRMISSDVSRYGVHDARQALGLHVMQFSTW